MASIWKDVDNKTIRAALFVLYIVGIGLGERVHSVAFNHYSQWFQTGSLFS